MTKSLDGHVIMTKPLLVLNVMNIYKQFVYIFKFSSAAKKNVREIEDTTHVV